MGPQLSETPLSSNYQHLGRGRQKGSRRGAPRGKAAEVWAGAVAHLRTNVLLPGDPTVFFCHQRPTPQTGSAGWGGLSPTTLWVSRGEEVRFGHSPSRSADLRGSGNNACPPPDLSGPSSFLFMWTTLKVFIEFITVSLLFYVLFCFVFGCEACGILAPWFGWDRTCPLCIRRSLDHWTTKEVPLFFSNNLINSFCEDRGHILFAQLCPWI